MKQMQARACSTHRTKAPMKRIRTDMEGPPVVQQLTRSPGIGPVIRHGYRKWYRARYLRAYRPQMEQARRLHQATRCVLTEAQTRVVGELRQRGYGWATFADL